MCGVFVCAIAIPWTSTKRRERILLNRHLSHSVFMSACKWVHICADVVLVLCLCGIWGRPQFWMECSVGFSGVLFGLLVVDIRLSGVERRRSQLPTASVVPFSRAGFCEFVLLTLVIWVAVAMLVVFVGVHSLFGLVEVPAAWYPWLLLILIQLIMPGISFLGHLGGLLAGYLCLCEIAVVIVRPVLVGILVLILLLPPVAFLASQIFWGWSPSWSPPRRRFPSGITGTSPVFFLPPRSVFSACLPIRLPTVYSSCISWLYNRPQYIPASSMEDVVDNSLFRRALFSFSSMSTHGSGNENSSSPSLSPRGQVCGHTCMHDCAHGSGAVLRRVIGGECVCVCVCMQVFCCE